MSAFFIDATHWLQSNVRARDAIKSQTTILKWDFNIILDGNHTSVLDCLKSKDVSQPNSKKMYNKQVRTH